MAEKAKFDREAAFKSIIGAGRQSENAVAAEEKNGKKNSDRVQRAYDAIALGEGIFEEDPAAAVQKSYDSGVTDEFMEPVVCDPSDPSALTEADLPILKEQYEILAKEMIKRDREGRGFTFYHYMIDLTGGPCIYKRISGCGSGTEYMAVTPWGDLYPCHQFVGDPKYLMGDIWKGVTNTAVRDEFKHCNAYASKECKDCWAKLYCSGGCAANSYHATGSITGVYEYGCELFKKRMECAIMIKVAENQELAAQGIEVPIELGSTCNACADGEACE